MLQRMNILTSKKTTSGMLLAFALGLVSCATKKVEVPELRGPEVNPEEKVPEVAVPSPAVQVPFTGDGMRMPDMFGLPGESEFRATNPKLPAAEGESGAVISRPPTDPPARVKVPAETAE
jgi:hypothetical protein